LVLAGLLVAGGLGACGSAADQTASSDPAAMAPASSVLYLSATVQPQGAQAQSLSRTIDRLGGPGTAARLIRQIEARMLPGQKHASFQKDVEPWLGQQVGLVITKWPANLQQHSAIDQNLAFIFPTKHPAAAQKALPALKQGDPEDVVAEVVGDYLLIGAKSAVAEVASTSTDNALANDPSYESAVSKFGTDPVVTAYLNLHSIGGFLSSAYRSGRASAAEAAALTPKFPAGAAIVAGLSTTGRTISLDTVTTGLKDTATTSATSIASLPSSSLLALGTSPISAGDLQSVLKWLASAASASGSVSQQDLAGFESLLPRITQGLGPMSLALTGVSGAIPRGGFELRLSDAAAAGSLVKEAYTIAQFTHAKLKGNASQFTITVNKKPSIRVTVGHSGNAVIATVGYASQGAFASPKSKLSDTTLYQAALAQLPPGSSVPFFLNIGRAGALVTADAVHRQHHHGRRAAELRRAAEFKAILAKLSYLIAGGTGDHSRIVLGLR
jgi:hypothetical protein